MFVCRFGRYVLAKRACVCSDGSCTYDVEDETPLLVNGDEGDNPLAANGDDGVAVVTGLVWREIVFCARSPSISCSSSGVTGGTGEPIPVRFLLFLSGAIFIVFFKIFIADWRGGGLLRVVWEEKNYSTLSSLIM